jgi:hypothetical protein
VSKKKVRRKIGNNAEGVYKPLNQEQLIPLKGDEREY